MDKVSSSALAEKKRALATSHDSLAEVQAAKAEAKRVFELRLRKEAGDIFDACGGDWDKIAAQLPGTVAAKMKEYVEFKVEEYEYHTSKDPQKWEGLDIREYGTAKWHFVNGHIEGLFYDV